MKGEKQEMQATTPTDVYTEHLKYLTTLKNPITLKALTTLKKGKIAGRHIAAGAKKNPDIFCDLRMKALRHQIQEMKARLANERRKEMKINVSRALDLIDQILKNLKDQRGDWVEIPANYYWDVVKKRYEYNDGKPPEPDYKDLVDDCHLLKQVPDDIHSWPLEDKVGLLVPLSNLLRAIGDHRKALSTVAEPSDPRRICDPEDV